MALPHDQVKRARPCSLRVTEPTGLPSLGGGSFVFLPEAHQGDALPFQLLVPLGPVG
jgi:hypothetical protein